MTAIVNQIVDGLYIGNYNAAIDEDIVDKHSIKMVVNCTKQNKKTKSEVFYIQVPVDDPPSQSDTTYINNNFLTIVPLIVTLCV